MPPDLSTPPLPPDLSTPTCWLLSLTLSCDLTDPEEVKVVTEPTLGPLGEGRMSLPEEDWMPSWRNKETLTRLSVTFGKVARMRFRGKSN